MSIPTQLANVTASTKANIYFEGRVVSHTLRNADGVKQTLGIIFPGRYHFATEAGERMEIVAGSCHVQLDSDSAAHDFAHGAVFEVPPHSGFEIEVREGVCEYLCTFLG